MHRTAIVFVLAALVSACGSGISDKNSDRNNAPSNNTTDNNTTANNTAGNNANNTTGGNNSTTGNNTTSNNNTTNNTTANNVNNTTGNNSNNMTMTCEGCMLDGACLSGDSTDGCGTLGDVCAVCSDGWQCVAGECVEPSGCSADNCAGCCDGTTCVVTDDDLACGSGGNACVACDAERSCIDGRCSIDPSSRWELVLVSGEVSSEDPMGETWDPFGPADPSVEFVFSDPVNGTTYQRLSTIAQDDETPTWNESIFTSVPARVFDYWVITVFDEDTAFPDTICGFEVDLTNDTAGYEALFDGSTHEFECQVAGSTTFAVVRVRLQPN